MSIKNAELFSRKSMDDENLREKVQRLIQEANISSLNDENARILIEEKIIPLAKNEGLEFNYREYMDFRRTGGTEKRELDLDELDAVSGGTGQSGKATLEEYCLAINHDCAHCDRWVQCHE